MSVRLSHDVFCDNCGVWIHAFISHKGEIRKARKYAKRGGWTHPYTPEGYVDLCPDCAVKWRKGEIERWRREHDHV